MHRWGIVVAYIPIGCSYLEAPIPPAPNRASLGGYDLIALLYDSLGIWHNQGLDVALTHCADGDTNHLIEYAGERIVEWLTAGGFYQPGEVTASHLAQHQWSTFTTDRARDSLVARFNAANLPQVAAAVDGTVSLPVASLTG